MFLSGDAEVLLHPKLIPFRIRAMIDVRVLIIRSFDGYRVRILASGSPMRSWLKVYPSKVSCLTELEGAKLAATDDCIVISTQKEPCWVIHTKTDSDLLTMLGFVEQRQLRIN
jgi:hypothetical protein